MDKKDPFDSPPTFPVAGGPGFSGAGPSTPSGSQLGPSPTFPEDTDVPKYTERPIELAYIPPGGEEPPPEFTPYEAEFFISGKEIVSHDPHLNEDGLLYP